MKTKIIAVIALSAILSVAAIVASVGQSALAINGANANSRHGANANGNHGSNGGHGEDSPKAGTGQNGGSNCLGCAP